MLSKLPTILLASALCVGASSCNSKDRTLRTFPPVADIQPAAEPLFPAEALEPTEAGADAEKAWWNEVLLWGRGESGKVARICQWAIDMGKELPDGYCEPR